MTVCGFIPYRFVSERERKKSNARVGVKAMKTSRIVKANQSLVRSGAGIFAIFFCLFALNGCATTESSIMSPEPDGSYKSIKISKIVLRSGSNIDCTDKMVFFEEGRDSSEGRFVITGKYNMVAGGNGESGFSDRTQYIPLSDVRLVYSSVEKVDGVKTTFAVIGTLAGTTAGVLVVLFTLGVGGFSNP